MMRHLSSISVLLLLMLLLSAAISADLLQEEENNNYVYVDDLCPNFGPMRSFKRQGIENKRYLGRWYQQQRHATTPDLPGKCWSQVYSRKRQGNPYELLLTMDYNSEYSNENQRMSFDVSVADLRDSNLLQYSLEPVSEISRSYRVLATDYETFSIEYTCQDGRRDKPKNENIWILSRRRKPPKSVFRRAYKALKALGLNDHSLNRTVQSCEAPPPVEEGHQEQDRGRKRFYSRPQQPPRRTGSKRPMTPGDLIVMAGKRITEGLRSFFSPYAFRMRPPPHSRRRNHYRRRQWPTKQQHQPSSSSSPLSSATGTAATSSSSSGPSQKRRRKKRIRHG